jgi:hypothetical protein
MKFVIPSYLIHCNSSLWNWLVVANKSSICLFSQRSILLDCETQIEGLLATVFENYKSLDENSPTGLTDHFGPASDSAAPALHPALQVYSSLHDILSPEAQTILQNYLQVIFITYAFAQSNFKP